MMVSYSVLLLCWVLLLVVEHGDPSPLGGSSDTGNSQGENHSVPQGDNHSSQLVSVKEEDKIKRTVTEIENKEQTISSMKSSDDENKEKEKKTKEKSKKEKSKSKSSESSSSESSSSDSDSDEKFKKKKKKIKSKGKLKKDSSKEKQTLMTIYPPESFSNSLSSESDEEYKIYKNTRIMELNKARERTRYQKEADRVAFSRGLQKLESSKTNVVASSESESDDTPYYKLFNGFNTKKETSLSNELSSSSEDSSSEENIHYSSTTLSNNNEVTHHYTLAVPKRKISKQPPAYGSSVQLSHNIHDNGNGIAHNYVIAIPERSPKVSTSLSRSLNYNTQVGTSGSVKGNSVQIPSLNQKDGLQIISTTNIRQNEGRVQQQSFVTDQRNNNLGLNNNYDKSGKKIDTVVRLQQNINGVSHDFTIGIPLKKPENIIYVKPLNTLRQMGNPVKGTINVQYNQVVSGSQNLNPINSAIFGVSDKLRNIGNMLSGLGIPGF